MTLNADARVHMEQRQGDERNVLAAAVPFWRLSRGMQPRRNCTPAATRHRCSPTTAFGVPVVPPLISMMAGSSGEGRRDLRSALPMPVFQAILKPQIAGLERDAVAAFFFLEAA